MDGNFSPQRFGALTSFGNTEKPRVVVRMTEWQGFQIEEVLPSNAPPNFSFLPSKVVRDGRVLWGFQMNHPHYHATGGHGYMYDIDDEKVIVLRTRDSVDMIIPLLDLPTARWESDYVYVNGRKRVELVLLKERIAQKLGLDPCWQQKELPVYNLIMSERKKEQARQEEALREQRRLQDLEDEILRDQRRARRAEIRSRPPVVSFSLRDNYRKKGTPVTLTEYESLEDGASGMLVPWYDPATRTHGEPIEYFRVLQKNARKKRVNITALAQKAKIANVFEGKELKAFMNDDEIEEAFLFTSKDAIEVAYKQSGPQSMYVMCPNPNERETNTYVVYQLIEEGIEDVTVVPMSDVF